MILRLGGSGSTLGLRIQRFHGSPGPTGTQNAKISRRPEIDGFHKGIFMNFDDFAPGRPWIPWGLEVKDSTEAQKSIGFIKEYS